MSAYRAFFVLFGAACCLLVGMLVLTPKSSKSSAAVAAAPKAPETGMIGTASAQSEAPLQAPQPVTHSFQPAPESIVLILKKNGAIQMDQARVTLSQLQQKLTTLHAAQPHRPVQLRYETGTPFQSISDVLAACHAAQLTNIAFVDTRPDKGSGQE